MQERSQARQDPDNKYLVATQDKQSVFKAPEQVAQVEEHAAH